MFVSVFLLLDLAGKQEWPSVGGTVPILTYAAVFALDFSVGDFHMAPTPRPGLIHTFVTAIYNFMT